MRRPTATATALFGGIALTAALAGCATSAPAETDNATTAPEPTETSEATTPDTDDTATSGYADGTYTETGQYQSPNGTESIDVSLTLEDGIVTAVEVTGHNSNPNTEHFQGEFIGGIADVVVGKSIDELQVDRVAGSSLTSGGFNAAVEAIKADATA